MATNTATNSKSVYLVDDDSSTVNLYSNRLEQAGFTTASAFNARQALEALPTLSADLIILDLLLPRHGGFQVLEAVRSDNRHKNTPVLVLSNAYLPEMAQRALRAGGNKALLRSECTTSQLISVSRALVGITDSPGSDLSEQLKKDLLEAGNQEVAAIRQHCLHYVQLPDSEVGKQHLERVYQSIRFLSTRAGLAGYVKMAQLTGTLEAMLYDQLYRLNARLSPSSMQTLLQAVDCLDKLFSSGHAGSAESTGKASADQIGDGGIAV